MSAETSQTCPRCEVAVEPADRYCEVCGARLPSPRDHVELDAAVVAGVSDIGKHHQRNEDAMSLAVTRTPTGPASVGVVCDGVSTSIRPDEAAQAAADVALQVLADGMRAGAAALEALTAAARAADSAVRALATDPANAPATTLVAGVMTGTTVAVCWIGDSRAYWLPADDEQPARLLTHDDSLASELAAVGVMSEAEAAESHHAHVVTRWLGADADPLEPHTIAFDSAGQGVLLLCSDGLWNYQPDAEGLRRLATAGESAALADAAAALLAFALDSGGQDNITVVLSTAPPASSDTTGHEGSTP
jgi:serine/threonine protein phosphatase PrpC